MSGLITGGVGAVVAAMAHSLFDFSLHILPNLILFGLLAGFLVGTEEQDEEEEERPERERRGLRLTTLAILVGSSAVAFAAGWREISAFPQAFRWERERIMAARESGDRSLDAMEGMVERAPNFALARKFGRMNLLAYRTDPVTHRHRLALAEEAFRTALDRNPFDEESLANLASVLELQGRAEEATPIHLKAVDRTRRREMRYGAMAALAANLAGRAERHLYQQQKDRARGFYERALEYLDASRLTGHRAGGSKRSGEFRNLLAARIETLQSEGVGVVYPPNVPPPPQ